MKRMGLLLVAGVITSCASWDRYLDPEYAETRYDQAVKAVVEQEKALACVSMDKVFWVRNGDWVEWGDDYLVVVDSDGKDHILTPYIANPNCTPKE